MKSVWWELKRGNSLHFVPFYTKMVVLWLGVIGSEVSFTVNCSCDCMFLACFLNCLFSSFQKLKLCIFKILLGFLGTDILCVVFDWKTDAPAPFLPNFVPNSHRKQRTRQPAGLWSPSWQSPGVCPCKWSFLWIWYSLELVLFLKLDKCVGTYVCVHFYKKERGEGWDGVGE